MNELQLCHEYHLDNGQVVRALMKNGQAWVASHDALALSGIAGDDVIELALMIHPEELDEIPFEQSLMPMIFMNVTAFKRIMQLDLPALHDSRVAERFKRVSAWLERLPNL